MSILLPMLVVNLPLPMLVQGLEEGERFVLPTGAPSHCNPLYSMFLEKTVILRFVTQWF